MAKVKRWDVARLMRTAQSVHPQPFRISWGIREREKLGGAATAACRLGLLQQFRGRPGADWFMLTEKGAQWSADSEQVK